MILFFFVVFLLVQFPLFTNSIRCYKCDATNECKDLSLRNSGYTSENIEIIDCEYYCWKSISLGKRENKL